MAIATAAQASTINLNTTTAGELSQETGISLYYAALIMNFRAQVGAFYSIDQLYDVQGLPNSVVERLRSDAGITVVKSVTVQIMIVGLDSYR